MSKGKVFKETYYKGTGVIVAANLNLSAKHVRRVLNGTFNPENSTKQGKETIKKIFKAAEKFKRPLPDK